MSSIEIINADCLEANRGRSATIHRVEIERNVMNLEWIQTTVERVRKDEVFRLTKRGRGFLAGKKGDLVQKITLTPTGHHIEWVKGCDCWDISRRQVKRFKPGTSCWVER